MKAMIMAAGVGSRLMPLTVDIPKPMIPVANRPLMESIVNLLYTHGYRELIANLHYHKQVISKYFGDGSAFGLDLIYSPEEVLLGTAGGVKNCEWFLDECFVVISGDALTDVNLTNLYLNHKKKGALATIALKEVEEVEQFGVVVSDQKGRIQKFQEKPKRKEALSRLVNTGIYIFEPEIFKYIPAGQFYDFGKQLFPHLVEIGAPFYGIPIDEYWCDVGDIETYRRAHADILQGKVAVRGKGIMHNTEEGRLLLGENVHIEDGALLTGNTVIGSGCRIEAGACIKDSVVWGNTEVKAGAFLSKCIVGKNCKIGKSAIINPGAAIASGCKLEDNEKIKLGQKVFIHLEEEQLQQA